MVITEVRIKLMEESHDNERLLAFCSITIDNSFVIRDLKIIEGTKGLFVAMPSRKLTDRCSCGCKNHLRARYCNQCGSRLDENRSIRRDESGRTKHHADIAHPINSACREEMQKCVIKNYLEERERAKLPGYVCTYDDYDGEFEAGYPQLIGEMTARSRSSGEFRNHSSHGNRPGHHMRPTSSADSPPPAPSHEDPRPGGFGAGIL